jgi:hypothetical protein
MDSGDDNDDGGLTTLLSCWYTVSSHHQFDTVCVRM